MKIKKTDSGKETQAEGIDFGTWLGRRHAFALMAGRCSAADAQCLREIRESKKYKQFGLTWAQACKLHAGMARSTADEIIRNLGEFGPDYFVINQVTGVSAREYRHIQGAVRDHKLLYAGQEIPIEIANAQQLVTAVEALRGEAAAAPPSLENAVAEAERCLQRADRAFRAGLSEVDKLRDMELAGFDRTRLLRLIDDTSAMLKLLGIQVAA